MEAGFPLPNVGGWYQYFWSRKWVFNARVDWLHVDIGDYSGGLWNASVGVNYHPWEHVGIGVFYSNFTLDADVDKSDWRRVSICRPTAPWSC